MKELHTLLKPVNMAQLLSEPVTTKDTACCQDKKFKVGSSCMQGWRVHMQDAHTHLLSLPDDADTAFFAVYDGHGGAKTADYACRHLHKYIIKRPEYQEGNIAEAMKQGFLGDSRAVASTISGKSVDLSEDHKPSNSKEYNRIVAAGGWVSENRVNGYLGLSRALGDYAFKRNQSKGPEEQLVIAYPDVVEHTIDENWEFIVLASDGIWEGMGTRQVVRYVRENIAAGLEPEVICENMMMSCLVPDFPVPGLGCDNMTVIIVALLHGDTYEKLQEKCKGPIVDPTVSEQILAMIARGEFVNPTPLYEAVDEESEEESFE